MNNDTVKLKENWKIQSSGELSCSVGHHPET